jgi:hypothetical protein
VQNQNVVVYSQRTLYLDIQIAHCSGDDLPIDEEMALVETNLCAFLQVLSKAKRSVAANFPSCLSRACLAKPSFSIRNQDTKKQKDRFRTHRRSKHNKAPRARLARAACGIEPSCLDL